MAFNATISLEVVECGNCGMPFAMPADVMRRLQEKPGTGFYCPSGHSQHYTGKSMADKLREANEKLERERRSSNEAWSEVEKKNKAIRSMKRRALGGMCPVCKRTFQQVARHVANRHPDCAADAGVKVISEKHNNPDSFS